jgi:hypothetical protein
MSAPDSILEVIDRCPPFAVYYGANLLLRPEDRLTVALMSQISGLSERTILRTAYRTSWRGVKIGVMDRFCRACRINILNPDPVLSAVRDELVKPKPFIEVPPHRRRVMLNHFNHLASKAAIDAAQNIQKH